MSGASSARVRAGVGRRRDLEVRRQARLPAELGEVVGDAADHVGGAVVQVDVAVAVEVDRVAWLKLRRHELRHADRAGVAALQRERVDALAAAQHEQLSSSSRKNGAAVLAAASGKSNASVASASMTRKLPICWP